MPCITVKTNQPIPREAELMLKQDFADAIPLLPRKTEQWLMCVFEGRSRLWFGGNDAPAALAQVGLFGGAGPEAYARLTAALTEALSQRLSIPPERVYIQYAETPYWGWNGKNLG